MEARLVPVNAVLGLVTANDINPGALAEAGFTLEGIEIPVTGPAGKVVIDVLIFNAASGLLVLFESKSGANVEIEQAKRYGALTPQAVIRASQITVQQRIELSILVVYACLEENRDRIRLGLTDANVDFPILAVAPDKISLSAPSALPEEFASAFTEPVILAGPPSRLIPFDQDSDVQNLIPSVRARLVAAMSHSRTQVTVPWLAEETAKHYALYGRAARNKLVKLVGSAALLIAAEDPTSFSYVPTRGNEDAAVKILKTPEDLDPRGRTQAYQALARTSRSRRRRPPESPGQLDLLSEIDVDNEDTATEDSDGDENT